MMRRIMAKLASCRAETLVETLAAILIVTLASLLFVYMAVSAGRVNSSAEKLAGDLRGEVAEAELGAGMRTGTVSVDGKSYDVYYSGESGKLASYRMKGAG